MTARNLAAQLRYLRPALIAVLVLDVLAVSLFAIRVQTITRTTTTPAAQLSAPVSVPAPATPVAPGTATAVLAPGPALSAEGSTGVTPTGTPKPTPAPTPTPSSPPTTPVDGDGSSQIGTCPVPLAKPAHVGGLQTLIGYAPAFGPFKDEAFAAAAAYQPLLQLLGPILAQYPQIAPRIEPALAPFLDAFAGLLDQGYALVAPLYAPHRAQVLDAEAKLAAALAPYAQKLVTSPLGGCVVQLQAALLGDTEPAAAKQAG